MTGKIREVGSGAESGDENSNVRLYTFSVEGSHLYQVLA